MRLDYETLNHNPIDEVFLWMELFDCVEFGVTMNGQLYGDLVGGADVDSDIIVVGTPTYSTVGACEWDAGGIGVNWLGLELTSGTVCGMPAAELASYDTTID